MSLTAFAMPTYNREFAVAYANLYGPTAGIRASLSPAPPIATKTSSCGWPVQRRADGSIDLDTYREAASAERTRCIARLVWGPLRRLVGIGAASPSSREPAPCDPDVAREPFEM